MNENSISISSSKLPIREYNGQRVVTFKDIDTVHERKDGTAKRNFYTNKERFVEGVDFLKITAYEFRTLFGGLDERQQMDIILVTESGYLMLAKSFTDDLAWKVQRELVNNYFRVKSPEPAPEPEQLTLETAEYHYFPKTFKGEPVITIADFEHFTGVSHNSVGYYLKKLCKRGEEYFALSNAGSMQFKRENPSVSRLVSELIVLKAAAVHKLLKYFGLSVEIPMIEEKKQPVPKETKAGKPISANVNECIIALGVLGVVRDNLKRAENKEAEEAINAAIKYTSWELSRRVVQ